ncbi:MAG: non-heme iron oxygenase ferredoxin subunit [Gammaproteobacteria bacterium]|nr:non-heme iron oxygenase ferredoxin subunit [Gammaproteobacteria bacterium]MCY4312209.1 non-heme iron oxygenase ferredoxin subunit [Gammaproteobacteria bacterium]
MSEWIQATRADKLNPGDHIVIDIDDVSVVVFNLDGEFYALENVCTHDGSELSGGWVVDDEIECPFHGARFCIRTGEVRAAPAYEPVDKLTVRVRDGMVEVRDDRWD